MSKEEQKNAIVHIREKTLRRDINKGYVILYLAVFVIIIVGGMVLYYLEGSSFIETFVRETIGNLMGVLVAFLIFNIVHEKISKDSYASEVSEQILDTLMYHPEAIGLYENEQKKIFVNEFIKSIVNDSDSSEMIGSFLNAYLLTQKDYESRKDITGKECRIRTSFSYRFVLETQRSLAFEDLCAIQEDGTDPYFYMQEELNYRVKYLNKKGNNTEQNIIRIGFIYSSAVLDQSIRENKNKQNNELLQSCLFRERLDIEEIDKKLFIEYAENKNKLILLIKKMFRPHINIDRCRGEICNVEIIPDSGIIVEFEIGHDCNAAEHAINIVFHIPKKWGGIVEVVLVEPTKEPMISFSYNEDVMDVNLYSFLNNSETSSYDNTLENENGIYSIALNDEWTFPMSGLAFLVKKSDRYMKEHIKAK